MQAFEPTTTMLVRNRLHSFHSLIVFALWAVAVLDAPPLICV